MQWAKKLERVSTNRNIVVGLVVTLVLGIVLMAMIQPQMTFLTGGLAILDARLFYAVQEVNQLFTALGEPGRLLYSYHQIIDSFFPAAYALTMALAIANRIHTIPVRASRLGIFVLLPIFAALFDYAENCLIATQLMSFPVLSELIVMVAATMTVIKWSLILVSFGAILVLAILASRKPRQ